MTKLRKRIKLNFEAREKHPFGSFAPDNMEDLIVGSFPIGKFTNPKRKSEISSDEIRFFYGGARNNLWKLIGDCFSTTLSSKEKIESLLKNKRIGVIDVIESCIRLNGSASDSVLKEIEFNPRMQKVLKTNSLKRLLFTSKQVSKWFHENWQTPQGVKEIILPSPSGQAPRFIGRTEQYKEWKKKNPSLTVYDYCLYEYKRVFILKLKT